MAEKPTLRHPFQYQKPTEEQVMAIEAHRSGCEQLYELMLQVVPPCAERTLAIRHLEECSMWANKAIVFDGESYLPAPAPRPR